MKYLDYIYYRITKAYMKWDGETGITAIMVVAWIVVISLIDIWGFIYLTFFFNKIEKYEEVGIPIVLIVGFVVLLSFFIRYRNRYSQLKKKWAKETKLQSWTRGALVLFACVFPFVLFLCLFL